MTAIRRLVTGLTLGVAFFVLATAFATWVSGLRAAFPPR